MSVLPLGLEAGTMMAKRIILFYIGGMGDVVWVSAQSVEYPAFVAFAEAVTRGLRAKPAGKSGR